ncbi:MAG: hypothetical protein ABSF35_21280 [Polyangia bacterium]|jgi:hypothetical protein
MRQVVAVPLNASLGSSWLGVHRRWIIALLVLVPLVAFTGLAWYRRSHPMVPAFHTVPALREDITTSQAARR